MTRISPLSPELSVAGALEASDFAEIARLGFRTVINNRLDGEEAGQLSSREEAVLSWRAGLVYRHVPAAKHEVLDSHVIEPLAEALASVPGPVLLHCRSGLRSTIMWAAIATDAGTPSDVVLGAAKAAGFDLDGVREEIAGRGLVHAEIAKPPARQAAA